MSEVAQLPVTRHDQGRMVDAIMEAVDENIGSMTIIEILGCLEIARAMVLDWGSE